MKREFSNHSETMQRAFGAHLSDADFELQYVVLGLDEVDIQGKKVLEIGSGRTNKFGREALKYFRSVDIVSINPHLAYPEVCDARNIPLELHHGSVAALAQGFLPFKDESFDTVFSVLGVPNSLLKSELSATFNDIWRVLRPGGVARLWPFAHRQDESSSYRVYDDYWSIENVPDEVLEVLPKPYSEAAKRIVIRKPVDEQNLPSEIAFPEIT